jgi:hypothetical protein
VFLPAFLNVTVLNEKAEYALESGVRALFSHGFQALFGKAAASQALSARSLPNSSGLLIVSCANNLNGFSCAKKHGKMKSANHQHRQVSSAVETVGVGGKVRRVWRHFGSAHGAVLPAVADNDVLWHM